MAGARIARRVIGGALAAAALTGLVAGCTNPASFTFLGTSHYDGRAFQEIEGQFEAIAIAPAGDRVAFRGRDSMDAFVLFVADVDGKVRKVASTGPSDGLISWSADGSTLYYLDMVPRPDGMFDGATIQRLTVDTGVVSQALYAVPLLPFAASPDGRKLLVAGETNTSGVLLPDARNHLLDPATGESLTLAPGERPVTGPWAAAWAPRGEHLALAVPTDPEQTNGTVSPMIASAPDWKSGQTEHLVFSGRYTAMSWEDDATLRVVDIVPGDFVTTTRLGTEGQELESSRVALDSPPPTKRYRYGLPLLSQNGRRVLLSRTVSDAESGMQTGTQHLLFDNGAVTPLAVPEGLQAVGWLGDRRLLFLDGFYQHRRPIVWSLDNPNP